MAMRTSILFVRSTLVATALVLAGAAHAQGYESQPYGSSSTGSSESTSGSGPYYAPSETDSRGEYEKFGQPYYGQQTSVNMCENPDHDRDNPYDHCGYSGTGPKLKGRY